MTCRCLNGPLGDPCLRCGRSRTVERVSTGDRAREGWSVLLQAVFATQDGMDMRTVRKRSGVALGRSYEPRA